MYVKRGSQEALMPHIVGEIVKLKDWTKKNWGRLVSIRTLPQSKVQVLNSQLRLPCVCSVLMHRRAIPCSMCGKMFFPASLPFHQKACAKKMVHTSLKTIALKNKMRIDKLVLVDLHPIYLLYMVLSWLITSIIMLILSACCLYSIIQCQSCCRTDVVQEWELFRKGCYSTITHVFRRLHGSRSMKHIYSQLRLGARSCKCLYSRFNSLCELLWDWIIVNYQVICVAMPAVPKFAAVTKEHTLYPAMAKRNNRRRLACYCPSSFQLLKLVCFPRQQH